MKKDFYVYAIVSQKDRRIYVGMSHDVDNRIIQHNARKVFSTKAFVPWIKFFSQFAGNADEARNIEKYYKSSVGKRKLRKILNFLDSGSLPD